MKSFFRRSNRDKKNPQDKKNPSESDQKPDQGTKSKLSKLRTRYTMFKSISSSRRDAPEPSTSFVPADSKGKKRAIDLSADDSGLPYERSYRFNLERAIKGVGKFKELYEAVKDNEWKDTLVNSHVGDELQALYLGIKPYGNFRLADGEELTLPLEIIKNYLPDHLEVTANGDVFSRNIVQNIIKEHKEYFPDYDGEPIDSYLSRRGSPYVSNDAEEIPIAQSGLLFGYPPNAAKRYAQYNRSYEKVLSAAASAERQDRNELAGQFLRKGHRDTDFLNQYQQAIYDLIDKYAHSVIEGTKEYVIRRRKVSLIGFVYWTDDPQSDENRAFAQRVQDAFKQSGMNDFVVGEWKENSSPE